MILRSILIQFKELISPLLFSFPAVCGEEESCWYLELQRLWKGQSRRCLHLEVSDSTPPTPGVRTFGHLHIWCIMRNSNRKCFELTAIFNCFCSTAAAVTVRSTIRRLREATES